MNEYSFNIYSLILIATICIAIIIAIVLWPRRKFRGVIWLILLEIAVAEWAFGILFESAATTLPLKQLWTAIAFIGTCLVPPFFSLFAVEYNRQQKRISKKILLLLAIMSFITIVLAFTDPLTHLLYTNITINPVINIAIYEHGFIWWMILMYEYILIIIAMYFLLKTAFKSGSFYTFHNLAIIIGALIPIIGNLVYVFGPNPIPGLDWAPAGFALSGVILTWAILRLKLFKIAPIAHTLLVENMIDGLIVLDSDNIIVDINSVSATIFKLTPKQIIGRNVTQFFPLVANLDELLQSNDYAQVEIDLGHIQPDRQFELRLSVLHDRFSQIIGKSLVLRDITEKKKAEAEREKLIRDLQEALNQVKTLSGLLPICSHCKKIRDDKGYWSEVETYIHSHSDVDFSHGICPECLKKYYPEIADRMESKNAKKTP
ncbi:MAG: histidine kinase N-terminal 7TM domain-containing protein [Candidatus Neomarinimicrobiota bacterium]|jgi:PAS domain S-box-containing protein